MEIRKEQTGNALTIFLSGRLETTTAPALAAVVKKELKGIDVLTVDITGLEYISSAGLRVLLNAQKTMGLQGTMRVRGANEIIREIFDITGFSDLLTVV